MTREQMAEQQGYAARRVGVRYVDCPPLSKDLASGWKKGWEKACRQEIEAKRRKGDMSSFMRMAGQLDALLHGDVDK